MFAAALSRDANARGVSVDERRAKRKQASGKLAGSRQERVGSTAKFGLVNILKQAPSSLDAARLGKPEAHPHTAARKIEAGRDAAWHGFMGAWRVAGRARSKKR